MMSENQTPVSGCWTHAVPFSCGVFFFNWFPSAFLTMLPCFRSAGFVCELCWLDAFHTIRRPAAFCCGSCTLDLLTSTVSSTVCAMFKVRNDSVGSDAHQNLRGIFERPLETHEHDAYRCQSLDSGLKFNRMWLNCRSSIVLYNLSEYRSSETL